MRTRAPVRLAVTAAALATGLSLAATGAAQASAARQPTTPADQLTCPASTFCMWTNANFTGSRFDFHGPLNTWIYVGPTADNRASSLDNNRGEVTWVAKNVLPSTERVCLRPHQAVANLATVSWPDGTSMNKSISETYLSTATVCPA